MASLDDTASFGWTNRAGAAVWVAQVTKDAMGNYFTANCRGCDGTGKLTCRKCRGYGFLRSVPADRVNAFGSGADDLESLQVLFSSSLFFISHVCGSPSLGLKGCETCCFGCWASNIAAARGGRRLQRIGFGSSFRTKLKVSVLGESGRGRLRNSGGSRPFSLRRVERRLAVGSENRASRDIVRTRRLKLNSGIWSSGAEGARRV